MKTPATMSPRQRLVYHVQELERLELLKQRAADCVKESLETAKRDGFDPATLKVVIKLRKLTPDQRRERRALEAIYLAALGMLEGEPLPDEARRRLDPPPQDGPKDAPAKREDGSETERQEDASPPLPPHQAPLILKEPDEARQEGAAAAAAGKRVYDNPYPAGDPCRAAWDEGWCAQQKSHGMETPAAYQRRTTKPPEKDKDAGDLQKKGAA